MPLSYEQCEALWARKSPRNDYKPMREHLNYNCNMRVSYDNGTRVFLISLYSTVIAKVCPDHYAFSMGGFNTVTTRAMINKIIPRGVVYTDVSAGYDETTFINGSPFFDGIRCDRSGRVFPEDIRPVHKTSPTKEVVQQYARLWRRIAKAIEARYALGEWRDLRWTTTRYGFGALLDIEGLFALEGKDAFIPHDMGMALLCCKNRVCTTFQAHMKIVRDLLRTDYYTHHDGFVTIELEK